MRVLAYNTKMICVRMIVDDVRAASRWLIFYWNIVTGPKYDKDRDILRPNVEINCNGILYDLFTWAHGMQNYC